MDSRTAVSVFHDLERARLYADDEARPKGADHDYNPPTFDVRLDAATDRESSRTYRVRVTTSPDGDPGPDDWRFVLEVAERFDLALELQNAGIELR